MNEDRRTIEAYADQVERHLVGSVSRKGAIRAELLDHLDGAADAGELADALRRLGSPAAAAASFARARPTPPAPLTRRLAAALVDNLPLIGVTVALFVLDLADGGGAFGAFPPYAYARIGEAVCVGGPMGLGCGAYDGTGLLYTVGVPLALVWSILGLGLIESGTGSSPGKRLLGLCVVTEAGLRVRAPAGILRRTSFLLGPLAWLDWAPVLAGRHRRILDYVAGTRVVARAES
ncbi:RDD family protein [Dactylosporangium sp. CA-233914]|uniref:RDD family protein n=1 Tax=Dactylosporangium sp. CA-233914 TaxID=3239934 RepID=UPI003D92CBE2